MLALYTKYLQAQARPRSPPPAPGLDLKTLNTSRSPHPTPSPILWGTHLDHGGPQKLAISQEAAPEDLQDGAVLHAVHPPPA